MCSRSQEGAVSVHCSSSSHVLVASPSSPNPTLQSCVAIVPEPKLSFELGDVEYVITPSPRAPSLGQTTAQ